MSCVRGKCGEQTLLMPFWHKSHWNPKLQSVSVILDQCYYWTCPKGKHKGYCPYTLHIPRQRRVCNQHHQGCRRRGEVFNVNVLPWSAYHVHNLKCSKKRKWPKQLFQHHPFWLFVCGGDSRSRSGPGWLKAGGLLPRKNAIHSHCICIYALHRIWDLQELWQWFPSPTQPVAQTHNRAFFWKRGDCVPGSGWAQYVTPSFNP